MSALPEQLTLVHAYPDLVLPESEATATIAERFAAFHEANPAVYDELRRLALDMVDRGSKRFGVKMLLEVTRWSAMRTRGDDSYKINNDFAALYGRLLADSEAALADVFEFRVRRTP